jgi:hypothetical protein
MNSLRHAISTVKVGEITVAGLASVVAAVISAIFGVTETIVGAGLAAMITTGCKTVYTSYQADVEPPTNGRRTISGGFQVRAALDHFSSLPNERRHSMLFGGLLAAVVALFLSLNIVTAVELSAGESLTCSVWKNCPGDAAEGTLPSIMGGGLSESAATIVPEVVHKHETPAGPGVPESTHLGAEEPQNPGIDQYRP